MSWFRLRDYLSVLLYRLVGPLIFARVGRRVRIVWPLRIVGAKCLELADDVTVQYGAYIAAVGLTGSSPRLRIGRGTLIGNHVHIICTRQIEIAEQVLIADRVYLADNRHDYADARLPVIEQRVLQLADLSIGAGTWIGENACIVGCTIGRHCVVGANSVVTRDVADFSVVSGSPAIVIKRYCQRSAQWKKTGPTGEFLD